MTMTMDKPPSNLLVSKSSIFQTSENSNTTTTNSNAFNALENYLNKTVLQNKIFNSLNRNQINFNGENMFNPQQYMLNLMLQTNSSTISNANNNTNSFANSNTLNNNFINNLSNINNTNNNYYNNEMNYLQLTQPFNLSGSIYNSTSPSLFSNIPYSPYTNLSNYFNYPINNLTNPNLQEEVIKVTPKNI